MEPRVHENELMAALRAGEMGRAIVALQHVERMDLKPDHPLSLPFMAFTHAATPEDGFRGLDKLKYRMPPGTDLNPYPALSVVSGLAKAIRYEDWYSAARHTSKIRHYCPDLSRYQLRAAVWPLVTGSTDHAAEQFEALEGLL